MHTASGNFTILTFTILSFTIHGITIHTIIHRAGPFQSDGDGVIHITATVTHTTVGEILIMAGAIPDMDGVIIHLTTGDIPGIIRQFMLTLTVINTDKEGLREPM